MCDLLGSLVLRAKNGQYCVIEGGSLQNKIGITLIKGVKFLFILKENI
jgi:hypothetical protein